jgi:tRNA (guanine-N7-)-methyltransferase
MEEAVSTTTSRQLSNRLRHNPYIARIREHQDKILLFENFASDCESISKLFSINDKIYCEIGSGSGGHIIECAKRHPDALFVGVEIRYKRACRTIEKAKSFGLENIYVLRVSAEHLEKIIPANSLDGLYVNFPDPWEKRKRRKNRVLSNKFLLLSKKILLPSGFVSIKTDHREYFESFLEAVNTSSEFKIVEKTFDLKKSPFENQNIQSEFEMLFRKQNLAINYVKLEISNNTQKENINGS